MHKDLKDVFEDPRPKFRYWIRKHGHLKEYFGVKYILSEAKLFNFHGIFKKNEIKSAKANLTPLYI